MSLTKIYKLSLILTLLALGFGWPKASAKVCNPFVDKCWLYGGSSGASSSSTPAYPSASSSIKLNPSGVPLNDAWGGEALLYQSVDFSLIKGNGRIGAAVSPSNNEETFFGPPGLEDDTERLERMGKGDKFKGQKITLAGAVNLWRNKKQGLRRVELNLGLIGRYNKQTKATLPGGGFSGVLGPFTLGYAYSTDETSLQDRDGITGEYTTTRTTFKQTSSMISGGLNLTSGAIDYSVLKVKNEDGTDYATVSLLTGSLFLQRWILTASSRREESARLGFNFKTRLLEPEKVKYETFAGIQWAPTKVLLLGVFHNYYLLRELSLGMTLFF